MPTTKPRCPWPGDDPLYVRYHDKEWGVPVKSDRKLFELLILEGAQAGLSWITVLRKREHYRAVFDDFDWEKVARYGKRRIETLLKDPGIIRNRLKVEGTVSNAKAFIAVRKEFGSFSNYLWGFTGGRVIQNAPATMKEVPPVTELATRISRDLKKRGFTFVGPTIIYAFMQAVGMVNDHLVHCFRHADLRG